MKNIAASVRQRLLDHSRREGRRFDELAQYYAIERFLYRLSRSPHAARFILKGGMLLHAWSPSSFRPTRDIDMLGVTSNDAERLKAQIGDILATPVEDDGLMFSADALEHEQIVKDAEYKGIRFRFLGLLGKIRISMQIDFGFGDIVYPDPEETAFVPILDFPAPKLRCYSRESVIAEKFEIMVKMGTLNSRMKDFYDVWLLANCFDFEASRLGEAVRRTFNHRGTELPNRVDAFEEPFITSKEAQWRAFWKRLYSHHEYTPLHDIVDAVKNFLLPVAGQYSKGSSNIFKWKAPGPWA